MASLEEELAAMRQKIEKARELRARAEAQLESLDRQKQEILEEMARLGVTPETAEAEISRLEAEARRLVEEARRLLP